MEYQLTKTSIKLAMMSVSCLLQAVFCLLSNSCDAEDDLCLIWLAPGSFDAKDIDICRKLVMTKYDDGDGDECDLRLELR